MNDQDAINELRDRMGRAENALSHGDQKFVDVMDGLTKVTAHLQRQDAATLELGRKIDLQGERTAAIVDMWDGGVNATRFFCRLARGWEWGVRQIFSKRFVALVIGYLVFHYIFFHSLPEWTKWIVAAYKIYEGN